MSIIYKWVRSYLQARDIKEYINNKVFRDIVSILYNTKFDFVVIEINRGMLVLKDTM